MQTVFLSLFIFFVFAIVWYVNYSTKMYEKKKWNDGNCTDCQDGVWVQYDKDSSGARMYKCDVCRSSCDISWPNIESTNSKRNIA